MGSCNCTYTPATMKHRVTIQSIVRASDSQGGYTESWTDVVDVWASIEPVKGYERYQAMQAQTPVTHNLVMRYRSSVTNKNRILYGTRVFDIKEVLNVGENGRYLQIKAMEQQ